MYLVLDFQVGLDIADSIAFYTNFEQNLIERLHHDFDGVCYDGVLILRVMHVVRHGECSFISPTMATIGALSVVFRALVVNYSPHDLLVGNVVVPIREHGRVTMSSMHANMMIIQTREDQDVAVLVQDAVAAVFAMGVLANPGSTRISVQANLFEPSKNTYYYPIVPKTQSLIFASEAMTRTKYASVRAIMRDISDIHELNVLQAAQEANEYMRETMLEVQQEQEKLPNIVRALFYGYARERAPPGKIISLSGEAFPLGTIQLLNDELSLPGDATCLIACSEYNPLDARIGVTSAPIASLPTTWIRGEPAQDAGIVLARRLESFIDYAIASATMAREFVSPEKITASRGLITLQAHKKQ